MIGVTGGSVLVEIGTKQKMTLFFECIKEFFLSRCNDDASGELVSRLLYKYVKYSDISETEKVFRKIEVLFNTINDEEIKKVLNTLFEQDSEALGVKNLSRYFSNVFAGIYQCLESSKINFDMFKEYPKYKYEPVMIVDAEVPSYLDYKNRSLEDMDASDDLPIWRR